MRSPGYAAARERSIAYRWHPSDHPRIRVRLPRDPIPRRALLAIILGLLLTLLGIILAPPA